MPSDRNQEKRGRRHDSGRFSSGLAAMKQILAKAPKTDITCPLKTFLSDLKRYH
jgi:hypothetical protein